VFGVGTTMRKPYVVMAEHPTAGRLTDMVVSWASSSLKGKLRAAARAKGLANLSKSGTSAQATYGVPCSRIGRERRSCNRWLLFGFGVVA
jgi:hypothetical protein